MSGIDWEGNPEATHFDPVDQNFLREVGSALLLFNKNKGWTVPVHTSYGFTIEDCHRPLIKRPEWDGEGPPPVGTICEVLWNESRLEYFKTKVFGINEHGQPIHRFEEGPKKYEFQADVLRTASGTQVFMPLKTPEQIEEEERSDFVRTLIKDLKIGLGSEYNAYYEIGEELYRLGYRKQEAS